MRVLGIDPGLKATGYGVIDSSDGQKLSLLETGTIEPKIKLRLEGKLKVIHKNISDLLKQYNPQILVLEKLYAHYNHPTTAITMGHARGVVCLCCAQQNIELVEHSVKRIRKAVTGNGNATKIQTRRVVAQALNVDESKLSLDASDALALAIGFIQIDGRVR